jgi:prepilin-type N-terminal cleavage/methylation domain-containing protein
MNKKGYTMPELLIVLLVFSIIYIVGVSKMSYAFSYDGNESTYESRINLIKVSAENYAKANAGLFKDTDNITIYAKDLIDNKYYQADEKGNIVDPRDTSKNLNDTKIKIVKNGEKYQASIE